MKHTITTLCLALSLTSCGIYTTYEQKNEVPENLFGDAPAPADSSIAKLPWREVFTDPKLQNIITEVLANNIDLQTAQLNIEQAQAQFKAAKLAYVPSLAFTPNGALSKYDVDGAEVSKTYTIPVACQCRSTLSARCVIRKKRPKQPSMPPKTHFRQRKQPSSQTLPPSISRSSCSTGNSRLPTPPRRPGARPSRQ